MIYLDNAATTPVRREAIEAMWPFLTGSFGNPSSVHSVGEIAARALRDARAEVARVTGCRPGDVIFTSGGTEADNLAVKGMTLATPRGRHIVTTPIEHEAVLESVAFLERVHGFEVTVLPVDAGGLVSAADLAAAIRDDTTLVSIQYANNEVGTVQPIAELAAVASARGIPFHTDAVQAAGWLPLGIDELGVDALSLAGHKVGAPKGIGALIVRGRIPLEPVLHGGGQERERRSGTENVAGAVAFATALRLAEAERADAAAGATERRDAFIAAVLASVPSARLTGDATRRLPGTASFVFPGTSGEAVLLELEQRDIISSSGSACAAGSEEASHVLLALGLDAEVAQTAVRFTLASTTTADELATAAAATAQAVEAVSGIRG
ncbi:cysteine desulfurase family protein [Leifsonia sp. Leaf264]|uniref:cysteine desulfurase family protein n=1 Tax=Leifsonia sp. Leaf264 TaxID=1736314 RepID=UPI0006FC1188|nr:cysteine desulfurase family protein [Leifsonia sp. Leaf264]KQP01582.1 cysteine desulfurase [Leifsonia sp. Leaf264]